MNTFALAITAINIILTAYNVAVVVNCWRRDKARQEDETMRLVGLGIKRRRIWFWQQIDYMRDGWSLGWWEPTWNPITWIVYAADRIRPEATLHTGLSK